MLKTITARSPGKLILSGEHAVVYGKPAIALAINRYAECSIEEGLNPGIFFNFLNLRYAKSLTLNTLSLLKERLEDQYSSFLQGKCGIREVLKKPFELLQFTVTHLLDASRVSVSKGFEIHSVSSIPIGCGMGSSSASVMSTLYVLAKFFHLEFDTKHFLSLGREAENLQHGRSSGLDLQLALSGGCLRFEEGRVTTRPLSFSSFTIVQTGVPASTTGECVEKVSIHFKDEMLKNSFEAVTNNLDKALENRDNAGLKQCIQENHRLLVQIGVVPEKVRSFISAIEKRGGAAKICGAGAVKGEQGGVVLVLSDEDISDLVFEFGFSKQIVTPDFKGTHLV